MWSWVYTQYGQKLSVAKTRDKKEVAKNVKLKRKPTCNFLLDDYLNTRKSLSINAFQSL